MTAARPYDLIVFGATGFTGRLIAEYLHQSQGDGGPLRWALAGRSRDKLDAVRRELGIADSVPLLQADASDPASLRSLVSNARAVITTVGPYQRHGEALVSACADAGTDYLDLCGEPLWMASMIERLSERARASGARIVFSCGFDSIPFDLGVLFAQDAAMTRFGQCLQRVRGRVAVMKGGMSGGTAASLIATLDAIGQDRALAAGLDNPFLLTPGFSGPAQPDDRAAEFDDVAQSWVAPFIMAMINTKNVHRSNALRGHPWGRDFIYDERMLTGDGRFGEKKARALARMTRLQNLLLGFGPARALIGRFALPQPGQGPSRIQRERGRYEIVFFGQTADGRGLRATVKGDRDPGYGSTSKMIAESALCLLNEVPRELTGGGVWTPASAMGLALVRRLRDRAGLSFTVQ